MKATQEQMALLVMEILYIWTIIPGCCEADLRHMLNGGFCIDTVVRRFDSPKIQLKLKLALTLTLTLTDTGGYQTVGLSSRHRMVCSFSLASSAASSYSPVTFCNLLLYLLLVVLAS